MKKINKVKDISKWLRLELKKIDKKVCLEGGYSYQIKALAAQLLWACLIYQIVSNFTGLTSMLTSIIQLTIVVSIVNTIKISLATNAVFGKITVAIDSFLKGNFVYSFGDKLLTEFIYGLIFGNIIMLAIPNYKANGQEKNSPK